MSLFQDQNCQYWKNWDLNVVFFPTNHGLGKQSPYSLSSPSQVELLSICSINVLLRSEVQLPYLSLLPPPSLSDRDFSISYPKTYLKVVLWMLFVFLSEPLKFSLPLAKSTCPLLYWLLISYGNAPCEGKCRFKWCYGIFKANIWAHKAAPFTSVHHIVSVLCGHAPCPAQGAALPCIRKITKLSSFSAKPFPSLSVTHLFFFLMVCRTAAVLICCWRAGGDADFHVLLQSAFLLPSSCFSHWLYLSLSCCVLHFECHVCPTSPCFFTSRCDAECSCSKNGIEVINSRVISSKKQPQFFPWHFETQRCYFDILSSIFFFTKMSVFH